MILEVVVQEGFNYNHWPCLLAIQAVAVADCVVLTKAVLANRDNTHPACKGLVIEETI